MHLATRLRASLLFLSALPALAQDAVLEGVVQDDKGSRLQGALVRCGEASATTNAGGEFRLQGALGSCDLAVSASGFTTLTESVALRPGTPSRTFVLARDRFAEDVTVTARLGDYVETSASASRLSARLSEIPQSIAVLPERFLEDLGALDTKELYKHISSVKDSPYSSTVFRGFTQREVLVNGARGNPYGSLEGDVSNSGFSTSQFRLTNVERVEVLKGPASVLYGSGEPGGIINYVLRRPRESFEARAALGTGTFGQQLAEADVSGPLGRSGKLLYRAAGYFEDRDHFRNNAGTRNAHAVAGLAFKPSAQTTVAVDYEYIDQLNRGHRLRGVPVTSAGVFLADTSWTVTEPSDFTDLNAHIGQARVDRVFASGVRFDGTARVLRYERKENYHEPRGLTAGNTLMQREFRDQFRSNDDWSVTLNVAVPFGQGRVRHEVVVGGDMYHQDHTFRFATARQQSAGGPVLPLSVTNPVYGTTSVSRYGLDASRFTTDLADSSRAGLYVQDLVRIGERVNLLLGGRLDTYKDSGRSAGVALSGDASAVSGRFGLVVKPTPRVSLYATTGNGFTRPAILSQAPSANGPHDPETSRHMEGGLKSEWFEGRVQFTASAFNTTKKNVLRPDPTLGPSGNNANAVLATGEARSRGLEIDIAGEIVKGWNLSFNYAALDTEILKDAVASLVGKSLPNAPKRSAGLFTRVDLPRGAAVGLSVEHVGDRVEPFAGIAAPAYTVVDAHYFQQITPRVKLLARVENLFDRTYAASSLFAARAGNIPGAPRTFSFALTIASRKASNAALR